MRDYLIPIIYTALISCFSTITNAQIISTIAGDGVAAYSGDGGLATAAKLDYPWAIYADNTGNIYFSEANNYCIRKVNSSHIINTVTGNGTPGYAGDGGPASAALINHAGEMFIDGSGNIYFADSYNNVIRKINAAGVISTIVGNGTAGFIGDGGPATAAELNNPLGIAFDSFGNLYIADFYNNRIRKVTTSGTISTFAGTGMGAYSGDGFAAGLATLYHPNFLLMDGSDNLFITDNANHCVRKINSSGIISTFAGDGTGGFGGDGAPATLAHFYYPAGISMDASGNLYVSDCGNSRLRMINTSGLISTIAGIGIASYSGDGGLATSAELNNVTGVACDNLGNIFIADQYNNRVRMIGDGDHPPSFAGGSPQSLIICVSEAPTPINSLLAVLDADTGQTETWNLITPPSHGTAVVSYSTISTGGLLTPSGLSYTPASGYTGSDVFMVRVTDGIDTAVVTINVMVYPTPNAGVISGIDSVCPGYSASLAETVSGGIWSTSSGTISTITSSGIATGALPGNDTIIYTVLNPCGIVSAIFPFKVGSSSVCHTEVNTITSNGFEAVKVYPNPGAGLFTVSLSSEFDEEVRFAFTNLIGEKIKELSAATNKAIEIELDQPPGIYFLQTSTVYTNSLTRLVIFR